MLSIASWNCQGDPTGSDLSTGFLQRLLTDYDLVVLQSCGALVGDSLAELSSVTVGRIRCHVRGMRQPISTDPFCSVAILSRLGSDHPLQGARAIEIGVAGRFGVACDVPWGRRTVLVAALHAVAGGIGNADGPGLFGALRAATGQPVLVSAELAGRRGTGWPGVGGPDGFALMDNRGIAHASPGGRHDSVLHAGLAETDRGVVDAGGASDHDAVRAAFGLPATPPDPISGWPRR